MSDKTAQAHSQDDWTLIFIFRALAVLAPVLCYVFYAIGNISLAVCIIGLIVGFLVTFSIVVMLDRLAGLFSYALETAFWCVIYFVFFYPQMDVIPQTISGAMFAAAAFEVVAIILHIVCFKFKPFHNKSKKEGERMDQTKTRRIIVALLLASICSSIALLFVGKNIGYNKGYRIGYDDGYVDGYTDGDVEGYEAGYDDGYADGEDYGYDRGYDAGHDSGVADSYTPSTYSYETYIGNANSYKFHRESCSYLPADWNQVFFYSREDAVNAGYDPCQKCNP